MARLSETVLTAWVSFFEQTANLIPDCTVELYEGKDHLGTVLDKRLLHDVIGSAQQ